MWLLLLMECFALRLFQSCIKMIILNALYIKNYWGYLKWNIGCSIPKEVLLIILFMKKVKKIPIKP